MDKIHTLLREAIGLDSASLGEVNLNRLIGAHMQSQGLSDAQAFWLNLKGSPEARARLIESVVIGETWFFRDPEAFEPILQLARTGCERLRILSLPCATGEEPYSLVMALLGQGSQDFEVDGLDVNEKALAVARSGVYGSNSFRSREATWKTAYFYPVGRQFQLRDSVRGRVRFLQANVANPKFLEDLSSPLYDAVIFRHLSMYLEPLTRQWTLTQIHQHLKPGGTLCVAPSEAAHVPQHLFGRTQQAGVFQALHEKLPQVRKLTAPRKMPRSPAPLPAAPPLVFQDSMERARQLGNQGQLEQALQICQELLSERGPSVEIFHLLAALASARGDWREQEGMLRKVLYLQPDHWEALLHLASLMESSGDRAQAERLRSRARRVLSP